MNWQSLTVAGAFVLGATLGTFAAIRVMRAVLQTFERPRRRIRNDEPKGE